MYFVEYTPKDLESNHTIVSVTITSSYQEFAKIDGMDINRFIISNDELEFAAFGNNQNTIKPNGWDTFFNKVVSDEFLLSLSDRWYVVALNDDVEDVFLCRDYAIRNVLVNIPNMFLQSKFTYYLPESIAGVLFKLVYELRQNGSYESIAMEMFTQQYKENVITVESAELVMVPIPYEENGSYYYNDYIATVEGPCVTFNIEELSSSWVIDAVSYYLLLTTQQETLFKFTADPIRLISDIDNVILTPSKQADDLTKILRLVSSVTQFDSIY